MGFSVAEYAEAVIFEQKFLHGSFSAGSGGSKNAARSGFPVIAVGEYDQSQQRLGLLQFHGQFAGEGADAVPWTKSSGSLLHGGLKGTGPLVLFSEVEALVMSFASAFMTTNQIFNASRNTLSFGLAASVEELPKDFTISTIITSPTSNLHPMLGIRQAMKHWGRQLKSLYRLRRRGRLENDFTATYLSYSTDVSAEAQRFRYSF